MTELIVLRHGELQAQQLALRLRDEPIELLVASDLQRARATAEASARVLGLAVQVEPLWREQAFGVLEGLDLPAIQASHGELWARWLRHEADFAPPGGGESNRQFHARVSRALQALVEAHPGRRVAVFTHGGVLDMLWRSAQGLPLHGARSVEIPNTGINRLRFVDGRLEVLQWADAAHLQGLPPALGTTPVRRPA